MMRLWEEVVQLASTIVFSDNEYELVWQLTSNGVYSTQSLYKIVKFRGVTPAHTPALWKIRVPPRVHSFLWLVSQNKILTRDNVSKRKKVDDETCVFCCEKEIVHHILFD